MSSEVDRRAGAARIPFEALVEVGGALGPSFEAQAINISEDGMQLRTAYLPEAGQPLTCRFDAAAGQSVMASGEVVWAREQGKGGEFAIRFTDVDPESIEALRRMCGVSSAHMEINAAPGSKVRLHIDGLASPMRARIKDSKSSAVTVGSDLGFLQVGKELELEDAESGAKRAAKIDRVEVAVDPTSRIPQLVVTLRYDSGGATEDLEVSVAAPVRSDDIRVDVEPPMSRASAASDGDLDSASKAAHEMKGAFARGVASIGPTFAKLGARAKTTVALLAAKRAESKEDAQAPRRTTAPAPGGGLHTAGRKVIRGESAMDHEEAPMEGGSKFPKRKVAIGGAVIVAAVLAAIAMKKPSETPAASTAAATSTATAALTAESHLATMPAPTMPAPQPPTTLGAAPIGAPTPTLAGPAIGSPDESADMGDESPTGKHGKDHKKHGKVPPFGNGPVAHGNILHLKMDGAIDALQGAQQPTGFTVKIPGRKSVEAAGPLAARDSRIASIKVTNDGAGAELTVAFKDGVPNYQVRAKNDTLEIALAPMGVAHKDKSGADGKATKVASKKKHGGKHDKHESSPDEQ